MMEFSIIWVEVYDPPTDGVFALPVREHGPAQAAIAKGQVKLVTEEQASTINAKFAARGDLERNYLAEKLAVRRRILAEQQAESSS